MTVAIVFAGGSRLRRGTRGARRARSAGGTRHERLRGAIRGGVVARPEERRLFGARDEDDTGYDPSEFAAAFAAIRLADRRKQQRQRANWRGPMLRISSATSMLKYHVHA